MLISNGPKKELEEEQDLKHGTKSFNFSITITLINMIRFNFSYSCNLIADLVIGIFHLRRYSRTH